MSLYIFCRARSRYAFQIWLKKIVGVGGFLLACAVYPHAFAAPEITVFALKGDGSATLITDSEAKVAWITDGGRGGASGVKGASIGGRDILKYLQDGMYATVVMTCSHPHEDHMGGLRELVRDERIKMFDMVFVDNDVPKEDSLYHLYETHHGETTTKAKARYRSAAGRNAFEGAGIASALLEVDNFAYDSEKIGEKEHDRSIIMLYKFKGKPPRTVVDFDDASTKLVEHWASHTQSSANILIYPHHGSRNNKIEAALQQRDKLGLKDVIITVNRRNRYLHPAPEILRKLLETFGPDHVFITDSELGENIKIDARRIVSGNRATKNSARLNDFIQTQITRYQALIRQEMDSGLVALALADDRKPVGELAAPEIRTLWEQGLISAKVARKLDKYIAAIADYEQSLKIIGRPSDDRTKIIGLVTKRYPGDSRPSYIPSTAPKTPSGGLKEYFRTVDSIRLRTKVSSEPSNVYARFQEELMRSEPSWGGIVFGNESTAKVKAKRLEFVAAPLVDEDSVPLALLQVELHDGSTVEYADFTNAELWSSYNFVQLSIDLPAQYAGRLDSEIGVMGLSLHGSGTFAVALHPAFAGTKLGWDAIYLDMLFDEVSAANMQSSVVEKPTSLTKISWDRFQGEALQWYDSASTIYVANGHIRISARDAPQSCLLRLRTGPRHDDSLATAMHGAEAKSTSKINTWPPTELADVCQEFPSMVRLERVARLVAILRWIRSTSSERLPDLPGWIQPNRVSTPDSYRRRDYRAGFFGENTVLNAPQIQVSPDSPLPPAPELPRSSPASSGGSSAMWITLAIIGAGIWLAQYFSYRKEVTSAPSVSRTRNPAYFNMPRNAKCWCGSEKRYKECHGKLS